MKIVIGLGNPGKKYVPTRHNVGFFVLDLIIKKAKKQENKESILLKDFKLEKKFEAEIAKFELGGEGIILVKPHTFMNNSGEAVKKIVDFYKIDPINDLVVIHDDIDVELGKIRIKSKGSSAGHNGVQSIIDNLGIDHFLRVRIGIGRPPERMDVDKYVLGKFSVKEKEIIEERVDKFIDRVFEYLGAFIKNK